MRLRADRVKVSVPATTMNLGPAFGSLGLALGRNDNATIRAVAGPSQVRIIDADTQSEPEYWLEPHRVERHLSIRALRLLLDHVGSPQVGVALTYRRGIPIDAGLGDREAQILVGLYGAWTLLGKPAQVSEEMLADLARHMRASPVRTFTATNGSLALGLPGGALDDTLADDAATDTETHPTKYLSFRPAAQVNPVVLVPGFVLPEEEAASILPRAVSFRRSAANAARSTALVPLITQDLPTEDDGEGGEWSRWRNLTVAATRDDIVTLHRQAFSPASVAMVNWLAGRGIAAFLSGAGPAVVCLWPPDPEQQRSIAKAGWRVLHTGVDVSGLTLDV